MKEIRNIIGGILILAWAVLLAVLMIRMPIADLLAGLTVLPLDIVISAAFCVIGIAAAVFGVLWRSKPLLLLSLLQAAFLIVFALVLCLYLVFFNGDLLAVGLYFANPFSALLSCPLVIFAVASAVIVFAPIAAYVIYARLMRKQKQKEINVKKSFRVVDAEASVKN